MILSVHESEDGKVEALSWMLETNQLKLGQVFRHPLALS